MGWLTDLSYAINLSCNIEQGTYSHWVFNFPIWSYIFCFPGGSVGEESACQCRRCRFDAWIKKIPWRKKWQHTPVFLPGKFHGLGAWQATVQEVAKSQTWLITAQLQLHAECLPSSMSRGENKHLLSLYHVPGKEFYFHLLFHWILIQTLKV